MAAFAAGRGRRAGRHDRDRGRGRRAERDGDGGHGRRPVRHLPAAPAARAGSGAAARPASACWSPRPSRHPRAASAWTPSPRPPTGSPWPALDLEQRREGDVLGARQSGGRSALRLLRVLRDEDLILAGPRGRLRGRRRRPGAGATTRRCARDRVRARRRAGRPPGARVSAAVTRIIAGLARGRRLQAPPGSGTRPTSDRVREALFSRLEHLRRAAAAPRVLDLYAGPARSGWRRCQPRRGAVGAGRVRPGDRGAGPPQRRGARTADGASVARGAGAERSSPARGARPFDLVLATRRTRWPRTRWPTCSALLVADGWLARGAVVVVERSARSPSRAGRPGWSAGESAATARRGCGSPTSPGRCRWPDPGAGAARAAERRHDDLISRARPPVTSWSPHPGRPRPKAGCAAATTPGPAARGGSRARPPSGRRQLRAEAVEVCRELGAGSSRACGGRAPRARAAEGPVNR